MKKLLFALTLFVVAAFSSICAYAGSWERDSVGWWYRLSDGRYYANTWFQDPDSETTGNRYYLRWYYFNADGYMVTNQWVGDYYLGSDGAMYFSQSTPDGYWVNSDGLWVSNPNALNNLAGLTGKFLVYFKSGQIDALDWDGDTLHIRGDLYRDSDEENLGYTEDWLELTNDSKFCMRDGGGNKYHYTDKESFKDITQVAMRLMNMGEYLFFEVYSGKIINIYLQSSAG